MYNMTSPVLAEATNKALMSGALWLATTSVIALATGSDLDLMNNAVDAAIMGGASVASDYAIASAGVEPSATTSAVGAGLMYTAIQKIYRGSDGYMVNFAMAAANDIGTEFWGRSM